MWPKFGQIRYRTNTLDLFWLHRAVKMFLDIYFTTINDQRTKFHNSMNALRCKLLFLYFLETVHLLARSFLGFLTSYFSLQAFSVFFVCIALTSDMICFLFIPVHWLFFAASTYVWVQYVWHTGNSTHHLSSYRSTGSSSPPAPMSGSSTVCLAYR